MTTASQGQHPQATPDDLHDAAFRAAVHAWLTEHSTDAFREQRNMPLQENVAVRCLGHPRGAASAGTTVHHFTQAPGAP
jgi:hypothetical protein